MSKISNKFYIAAFFILFAVSTVILLIASTTPTPVPAWGGYIEIRLTSISFFLAWHGEPFSFLASCLMGQLYGERNKLNE